MAEQSLESFRDDGSGQIACPLKQGVIAIQRCHEYQAESESRGAPCTCATFRAYDRGEPRGEGTQSPERRLCGTVTTIPAAQLVTRELDRIAREYELAKEPPMSKANTHAGTKAVCVRCGKPSPEGTHISNGICKPCRGKDIKEAAARIKTKRTVTAESIEAAAAEVATATTPEERAGTQLIAQPIAESEIIELRKQIEQRDRKIAALSRRVEAVEWLSEGISKGFIGTAQAALLLPARS